MLGWGSGTKMGVVADRPVLSFVGTHPAPVALMGRGCSTPLAPPLNYQARSPYLPEAHSEQKGDWPSKPWGALHGMEMSMGEP